jgi:hypothetical protein
MVLASGHGGRGQRTLYREKLSVRPSWGLEVPQGRRVRTPHPDNADKVSAPCSSLEFPGVPAARHDPPVHSQPTEGASNRLLRPCPLFHQVIHGPGPRG